MSAKVRLLIVDDSRVFRTRLEALLEPIPDIEVVEPARIANATAAARRALFQVGCLIVS